MMSRTIEKINKGLTLNEKARNVPKQEPGFQWRLSLDDYPEVGSLINTHLGVGVVMEVELVSHKSFSYDWFPRAVADVGEMNVLSFYDEHKSDCLEDWGSHKGLAVKLTTNKSDYHYSGGPKWVLFSHPRYNRAGPLMDRTWWCGDYYTTFSHINPECLRLKA